jgi:hypothetical protein
VAHCVTGVRILAALTAALVLCTVLPAAAEPAPAPARAESTDSSNDLGELTVTAERLQLIGTAATASEGVVVNDELALLPAYSTYVTNYSYICH